MTALQSLGMLGGDTYSVASRLPLAANPEGPQRHLAILTQRAWRGILMPRGKNCRETIFAAQLPRNYPRRGGNFESRRKALSCGGEAIWEVFLRGNLGEGNCESRIAARQWGVNFCREASRCLAVPSVNTNDGRRV